MVMRLKSVILQLLIVLSANLSGLRVLTTVASTTTDPDVSSRLTQCLNIFPRYPPPNQFACYRTRTRSVGPFQTCDATLVRQNRIPSLFGGVNFTQFYVQTPGRLRGRSYNNRLLCRWNVECRNDQLLYVDITEHNIEPKQHSSLFRREVCSDYLALKRDFGVETSCGFRDPYTELEARRIRMEFRSNTRLRFPGVRMRLACFNPVLQDLEGCSPTDNMTLEEFSNLRRKRHIHTLDKDGKRDKQDSQIYGEDQTRKIPFQEKYLQYFDKTLLDSDGERHKRSIQDQIIIDKTAKLYFRNNLLLVVINKTIFKYIFENINTLHTYNVYEGFETFHSYPNVLKSFRGRGVLTVIHETAFYVIYGPDLERFEPNENETVVIRMLMEVEEEMLDLPSQDFIIRDKVSHHYYGNGPIGPTSTSAVGRRKRQTSVVEPEVIAVARRGATSCNAVLRGIAQSILELSN